MGKYKAYCVQQVIFGGENLSVGYQELERLINLKLQRITSKEEIISVVQSQSNNVLTITIITKKV